MRLSRPALVAIALAVAPVGSGLAATDVPLSIVNPGGAIGEAFPLRLGVPLPRGRFGSDTGVRVRMADDKNLPAQTAIVERWPDGSIRWLLVDFVAPTLPIGSTTATLRPAPGDRASRADPGIALHDGTAPTLRSAHLAIDVAATGRITIDLLGTDAPDVIVAPLMIETGTPGDSRVRAVRVRDRGPVRAEIVIAREHPGGLETETSVVAWADVTTVLLRTRVLNRAADPAADIRGMPLAITVPAVERAVTLLDRRAVELAVGETPTRLIQSGPATVESSSDITGSRLGGAVRLGADSLALSVVLPDFWQTFPKALTVSPTGLEVDLLAGGTHPVRLGIGAAKTHDVWIRLDRPRSAPPLAALADRLARPPRAVAPARWTHESEALPGILDPADPDAGRFLARLRHDALRYDSRARYERWDDGLPGRCDERASATPRLGFYGAIHWGDWNFPGYRDGAKGCDAWGNLEYDLPLVFGLAFASTGDPLWAEWFDRALRHYRDVDLIQAAPAHPEWVGLNHPHKVGHFDWRGRGNVDLGHAWLGGLLLHHRLTGDVYSGDAAVRMADRLAERADKASNPRHFGWPMIALGTMADAMRTDRYRQAALRYAALAMDRFAPDPEAGDWKLGILASGLAAVHRATGDAAVRTWLLQYGEHVLAAQHASDLDPRYLAVCGYLAELTDDARYRTLARTVAAAMPIGTWGKTLAMRGRIGFELLGSQPPPRDD